MIALLTMEVLLLQAIVPMRIVWGQEAAAPSPDVSHVDQAAASDETGSGGMLHTGSGAVTQETQEKEEEHRGEPQSSVFISEILWAGSDLSTADEWVELGLPADASSPADMSGWTLSIQKETEEEIIAMLPVGLVLSPGGAVIIANYAAENSRLAQDAAVINTSISLPNTKLLLRLRSAQGAVIDDADDGVGTPFAGANPSDGSKASMERIHAALPGHDPAAWATATQSIGFDPDAPMYGTPGMLFSPPVAAEPTDPADVPAPDAPPATEEPNPDIPSEPYAKLFISEMLPNPPGSDDAEWIELGWSGSGRFPSSLALVAGSHQFALNATLSGRTLAVSGTVVLPRAVTGIRLPNAGGEVQLLSGAMVIDTLLYPSLPEGVSMGRLSPTNEPQPFCSPTPGQPNTHRAPDVRITVQSGNTQGTSVTPNLKADVLAGAAAAMQCRWDYGDGYGYRGCNPPGHAMRTAGEYTVRLEAVDYCGNTVIQTLPLSVHGSKKDRERAAPRCTPQTYSGILVTEFLPDPDGDDAAGEWIELFNPLRIAAPLCGWQMDDDEGGSKPFSLDAWQLPPGERLVFSRRETGLALNNDKDSVRLIAPVPTGGTGVLLAIPYSKAQKGKSFARPDDADAWTWALPTPGTPKEESSATVLQESITLQKSRLLITAALPDPAGKDDGLEWVEIKNVSDRPQWLDDWHLSVSNSVKNLALDGIVLPRGEKRRIFLEGTGITLRNTDGAILLTDAQEQVEHVLTWTRAPAARRITLPPRLSPATRARVTQVDAQGIRVQAEDPLARQKRVWQPSSTMLRFPGIEILNEEIMRSLLERKEIDLQMYSNEEGFASIDGVDIQRMLLEAGAARLSHRYTFPRQEEYAAYEWLARTRRRGMWADNLLVARIDALQSKEARHRILEEQGIALKSTLPGSIAQSGSLITFAQSHPAPLYLSVNGEPPRLHSGSLVIHGDTQFVAYAETLIDTGPVRSNTVSGSVILLRENYARTLQITEVHPSPHTGEAEWVELKNIGPAPMPLLGWTIDDVREGGSKPRMLTTDRVLHPGQRLLLSGALLPITLNNGGDEARLIAPSGRTVSFVRFASVKKGFSVALRDNTWCLTTVATPLEDTVCKAPPPPASKKKKAGKQSSGIFERLLKTKFIPLLEPGTAKATAPEGIYARLLHSRLPLESDTQEPRLNITDNRLSPAEGIILLLSAVLGVVALWVVGRR